MATARFIKSSETYPLRLNVLWPHLRSLDECSIDIDKIETTFHIGVQENNEIVTIATFLKEQNNKLDNGNHYRLRAMATSSNGRGKGYGKLAIDFAIDELKKRNVELLWCDAREIALGFYEKIGFTIIGDYYNVRNIGPHKMAFKKI